MFRLHELDWLIKILKAAIISLKTTQTESLLFLANSQQKCQLIHANSSVTILVCFSEKLFFLIWKKINNVAFKHLKHMGLIMYNKLQTLLMAFWLPKAVIKLENSDNERTPSWL